MSSILDALKKADREAAAEKNKGKPWSNRMPLQRKSNWRGRGWLTGIVFFIVVLAIGGFFSLRPQTMGPSGHQAMTEADPDSNAGRTKLPQSAAPDAGLQLSEESEHPVITPKRTIPSPEPGSETAASDPSGGTSTALQIQTPSPTAEELTQNSLKPSPGSIRDPLQPPTTGPAPTVETGERPTPLPERPTDAEPYRKEETSPVEEKNIKDDPRIDLQALVWAEKPEDRFVVINNQLIREGGTIDAIVVEEINPDDVRLVEGSNQWYEAFHIR